MEPNATMQLRDIKPLVEIADSSVYLYWGLILLGICVTMAVGYFLYQKLKIRKNINREKEYLEILNTIDWSSPKKAAYQATYYGRLLATDDRRRELFSQLMPYLERYKYKKEVEHMDEETVNQFELYRRICNGSV